MSKKDSRGDSGSNLTYLHKHTSTDVKDGKATVTEEYVIHGDKGLMFKYYFKDDKTKQKIIGKQESDGGYLLVTTEGDKTDEKKMSKDELLKVIAKNKDLKFAVDYLKTQKGGKKGSRKGSKKGSKKASKSKW